MRRAVIGVVLLRFPNYQNGQKARSVSQDRPELNSRRRTPTGQTNKPNSTFRRTVGGRGRDIDNLHKKCQKLTDLLHSTDDSKLQVKMLISSKKTCMLCCCPSSC